MTVVYRLENLTKVYRRTNVTANDALSLEIREGEIFGLLGPNGAGKTTLVRQMAGLLKPTSGKISLYGNDIARNASLVPRFLAMQPQHAFGLASLKVREAIFLTGRIRGLDTSEARRQTEQLMHALSLESAAGTLTSHLSGGQRRLVTLAVTFVAFRPVLIFDEPTNDLDPVMRRTVWNLIRDVQRGGGTVILVTHNVLEAERVIERVGIITRGRLIALGTPGELKRRVDQQVRLELVFRNGGGEEFLLPLPTARKVGRLHWVVYVSPAEVEHMVSRIVREVGLETLEDFRILTPTLEDVYLHLGGDGLLG